MEKGFSLSTTIIINTALKCRMVAERCFYLLCSCFHVCQQETPEPDRTSIYRSLVVNTSKEMMCFSDFPMPSDYPNFMHNSQLLQYFRLYAEHFDLLRYINFQVDGISSAQVFYESSVVDINVYFSVNVGMHTSDHSEECFAKAGFLSIRPMGSSDHKQEWTGREAHL